MNRETKVAIVLSAGLLAAIALLVGDYVATDGGPSSGDPLALNASGNGIGGSGLLNDPTRVDADLSAMAMAPAPLLPPSGLAEDPPRNLITAVQPSPLDTSEPVVIDQGSSESIVLDEEVGRVNLSTRGAVPVRDEPEVVVAAGADEYKVEAGDTLSSIAQRRLGSSREWRRLLEVNADRLEAPERLRVGMTLVIPNARPDLPTSTLIIAEDGPPSEPRTYVVARGDTLSQIAQRELGSTRRQADLLEMNPELADDPDAIVTGLVLRLPTP